MLQAGARLWKAPGASQRHLPPQNRDIFNGVPAYVELEHLLQRLDPCECRQLLLSAPRGMEGTTAENCPGQHHGRAGSPVLARMSSSVRLAMAPAPPGRPAGSDGTRNAKSSLLARLPRQQRACWERRAFPASQRPTEPSTANVKTLGPTTDTSDAIPRLPGRQLVPVKPVTFRASGNSPVICWLPLRGAAAVQNARSCGCGRPRRLTHCGTAGFGWEMAWFMPQVRFGVLQALQR